MLIATIRKATERTEELQEAEYRSPTSTLLQALQQISSAMRMEGEAAMSAQTLQFVYCTSVLEIIIDLPIGFPINNIISLSSGWTTLPKKEASFGSIFPAHVTNTF